MRPAGHKIHKKGGTRVDVLKNPAKGGGGVIVKKSATCCERVATKKRTRRAKKKKQTTVKEGGDARKMQCIPITESRRRSVGSWERPLT